MASKIKVGDTVRCTHAATSWYKTNAEYKVVKHPMTGMPSVQGSDEFFDMLSLCVSTFKKLNKIP